MLIPYTQWGAVCQKPFNIRTSSARSMLFLLKYTKYYQTRQIGVGPRMDFLHIGTVDTDRLSGHVIKFIAYSIVALCLFGIIFRHENLFAMWSHQAQGKYSWIELTRVIDKILITVKHVKGKCLRAKYWVLTSCFCIKWISAFFMERSYGVIPAFKVFGGEEEYHIQLKSAIMLLSFSEKWESSSLCMA